MVQSALDIWTGALDVVSVPDVPLVDLAKWHSIINERLDVV